MAFAVPRLNVLHASDDARVPFEEGMRTTVLMLGSRFVPLDGDNHVLLSSEPAWVGVVSEVRGSSARQRSRLRRARSTRWR